MYLIKSWFLIYYYQSVTASHFLTLLSLHSRSLRFLIYIARSITYIYSDLGLHSFSAIVYIQKLFQEFCFLSFASYIGTVLSAFIIYWWCYFPRSFSVYVLCFIEHPYISIIHGPSSRILCNIFVPFFLSLISLFHKYWVIFSPVNILYYVCLVVFNLAHRYPKIFITYMFNYASNSF